MNEKQIKELLECLDRIADALEGIELAISNIDDKGIDTYEQASD